MPQTILPLIPEGATSITDIFSVFRRQDRTHYFCGINPIFSHATDDQNSFRMFTSQLVCEGNCKQADIIRVFGVSPNSVRRGVRKFRRGGVEAFYEKTSLISTAYRNFGKQDAAWMFSRWAQENFFGYMMEHFDSPDL